MKLILEKIFSMVCIVSLIAVLGGCAGGDVTNQPEQPTQPEQESNELDTNQLYQFENKDGIDFSQVKYIPSETEKDQKLEDAFAEVYDLKRGEDQIRYYYNRIDLDGDDQPETFVFLVGSSVCGTGGCSGLIFKSQDDDYELVSRFTLVRNPVIVSQNKTNDWNDLIMYVSGGGIENFFAQVKYDEGKYPLNPSVQPKVESGTQVEGTAIIADDLTQNKGIAF